MPISSGALGWPTSYWSKPKPDDRHGGAAETGNGAPRRLPPHQWQPKLANREDYEKWRKEMDRKDPIRTRRKKSKGCCGFLSSTKLNTENEDPTKGQKRDSPREVIKRQRRRWCVLLGLVVSLLCFLLAFLFVFLFLRYTGHEVIGPDDLVSCTGKWRQHFLGFRQQSGKNGTAAASYGCCYLPDVKDANLTVWKVTRNSGWPDGYLLPSSSDCNKAATPDMKCTDYSGPEYDAQQLNRPPPCDACAVVSVQAVLVLFVACNAVLIM